MSRRAPTPFDLLVSQADRALRTLTGDLTNSGRANPASPVADAPLTESEKRHAAGLMRVNHAGEVAAQGLYQGQALTARLGEVREAMQQAAIEEVDHLEWCEERLEELDSQPSALSPLWYAGAFAIGATAGLIGDRWSLGFVAETEHQVVKHLDSHLDELPETDEKSRAIVEQMKEDEARHGATAQSAGGRTLPLPIRQLMTVTARIMTRSAYWF